MIALRLNKVIRDDPRDMDYRTIEKVIQITKIPYKGASAVNQYSTNNHINLDMLITMDILVMVIDINPFNNDPALFLVIEW